MILWGWTNLRVMAAAGGAGAAVRSNATLGRPNEHAAMRNELDDYRNRHLIYLGNLMIS